jgi:hypothetical protein
MSKVPKDCIRQKRVRGNCVIEGPKYICFKLLYFWPPFYGKKQKYPVFIGALWLAFVAK